MPHPSRRKGFAYERELVNQAQAAGLPAERAVGSDGRALGEASCVDLTVCGFRVQAKRRKSVASYLTPPDGADLTIIREDRGESFAVVPYRTFLQLVRRAWRASTQ